MLFRLGSWSGLLGAVSASAAPFFGFPTMSKYVPPSQRNRHGFAFFGLFLLCIVAITATGLVFRDKLTGFFNGKGSAESAQSSEREVIDLTTHAFCDELNPTVVRAIAFNGYRTVGMPTADRGASALEREEYKEQLRMQPLLQAQHKAEVELRAAKMSSIVASVRATAGTPTAAANDQAIMIGRKHAERVIGRLKALHAETTVDEAKVNDAIREAHRQAIAEARALLKK